MLKRLRSEGLALLYISHRMHEIAELADDCTVFRNGRKIATYKAGTKTDNEVVELMIGREYQNVFPPKPAAVGTDVAPVLECQEARLDRPSLRHQLRRPAGRGDRARRPRRAGSARTAACAVRRAQGLHRRGAGRRAAGKPQEPGACALGQDRHGADPGGPQDRGADAADDGAREPRLRRHGQGVQPRHHRPRRRKTGCSTRW